MGSMGIKIFPAAREESVERQTGLCTTRDYANRISATQVTTCGKTADSGAQICAEEWRDGREPQAHIAAHSGDQQNSQNSLVA